MKTLKNPFLLLLIFAGTIFFSCNEQTTGDTDTTEEGDNPEYQMEIVPEKPVEGEEVTLVTYDCSYNQLQTATIDGTQIDITKRFNSMSKQPCVLAYDSISLGALSKGSYKVTYWIIDTSKEDDDNVFLKKNFHFNVFK